MVSAERVIARGNSETFRLDLPERRDCGLNQPAYRRRPKTRYPDCHRRQSGATLACPRVRIRTAVCASGQSGWGNPLLLFCRQPHTMAARLHFVAGLTKQTGAPARST